MNKVALELVNTELNALESLLRVYRVFNVLGRNILVQFSLVISTKVKIAGPTSPARDFEPVISEKI